MSRSISISQGALHCIVMEERCDQTVEATRPVQLLLREPVLTQNFKSLFASAPCRPSPRLFSLASAAAELEPARSAAGWLAGWLAG